jgi:hypothetical protein
MFGKLDVWCLVYNFISLLTHQSFYLMGSLTLLQKSIKFFYELVVQWLSGSLVWIYDIIVSYDIMILGHGEWTMGIWLLSLNWLFLMATKAWVLSWYLMTIITWVLVVNTNELLFVFMIHVYMDMEILKPSTNFLLGLLELRFFSHDVLTFSFM